MIDPVYLASLEERIKNRITDEWPGVHNTHKKLFIAGVVKDGGATQALIELSARIAVEEFNKF